MLGVAQDGSREVLGVVNHPTEGALCRKEELEALKERGVKEIDLIVSDALQGIENAVCAAFPSASHQFCVAHLKEAGYKQCVPQRQGGRCKGTLGSFPHGRKNGKFLVGL